MTPATHTVSGLRGRHHSAPGSPQLRVRGLARFVQAANTKLGDARGYLGALPVVRGVATPPSGLWAEELTWALAQEVFGVAHDGVHDVRRWLHSRDETGGHTGADAGDRDVATLLSQANGFL